MSLYAAIDLHSNNSVLAIIDETDAPLRQRRLPNDLPAILKELEPFREEITGIVVESTYNWYWLVDGLKAHGYRLHLANTAAVPQYAGLKYSGDESDARHLAHPFCTNPFSPVAMAFNAAEILSWLVATPPISREFGHRPPMPRFDIHWKQSDRCRSAEMQQSSPPVRIDRRVEIHERERMLSP
jgi:hypothetical protein